MCVVEPDYSTPQPFDCRDGKELLYNCIAWNVKEVHQKEP